MPKLSAKGRKGEKFAELFGDTTLMAESEGGFVFFFFLLKLIWLKIRLVTGFLKM